VKEIKFKTHRLFIIAQVIAFCSGCCIFDKEKDCSKQNDEISPEYVTVVPQNLIILENKVVVELTPPAEKLGLITDSNNDTIKCFSTNKSDTVFTNHLIYLTNVAIATGHPMRFSFYPDIDCDSIEELDDLENYCRTAYSFELIGYPENTDQVGDSSNCQD